MKRLLNVFIILLLSVISINGEEIKTKISELYGSYHLEYEWYSSNGNTYDRRDHDYQNESGYIFNTFLYLTPVKLINEKKGYSDGQLMESSQDDEDIIYFERSGIIFIINANTFYVVNTENSNFPNTLELVTVRESYGELETVSKIYKKIE